MCVCLYIYTHICPVLYIHTLDGGCELLHLGWLKKSWSTGAGSDLWIDLGQLHRSKAGPAENDGSDPFMMWPSHKYIG